MSFGALGQAAVRAMNQGALAGGFAHDTGEGGLSRYHKEAGGDLIWQIGTGYFGCRDANGDFDPEAFQHDATLPQVKMIEIKVSQGAKPGHGGILPAAKVTAEIAEARLVPAGQGRVLPDVPQGFLDAAGDDRLHRQLRELSEGKPVGFKLCVGDPREFMAIIKAMIQTGIYADFIVVDGGEGGTGAAPLEFSDSLGAPLNEGLLVVGTPWSVRVYGTGSRSGPAARWSRPRRWPARWPWVRTGATRRGRSCSRSAASSRSAATPTSAPWGDHPGPKLQRALIVTDKSERVHNYHRNTVHALAEMIAAMGLDHTSELEPAPRRTAGQPVPGPGPRRDLRPGATGRLPGRHRDSAIPGVLGPGLGRVVPPLVRLRAGSARLAAAEVDDSGRDHRVVIVGGGLRRAVRCEVPATGAGAGDAGRPRNHHLFQPLLYQLATGILSEGEVAPPIRDVLRRHANVSVEMATVTGFDLANRIVNAVRPDDTPRIYEYDSLIVGAGAAQSYFGHDEFARFASGMKTIDDALELRGRIFGSFEMAEMRGRSRTSAAHG